MDDFLPDTLLDCSVGTLFYSTVYAYTTLTEVGQSPAQFDSNGTARVGGGHRGVTEIVRSLESTQ